MSDPIVMISSYPPRLCGIGTFCEEAREFIQAPAVDELVQPVLVPDVDRVRAQLTDLPGAGLEDPA